MNSYRIERYGDDLVVWSNNKQVIKVIRRHNWLGKLKSRFFIDGTCVLTTTYDQAWFRKYLTIKEQHLPVPVSLIKMEDNYLLNIGQNLISFENRIPGNPLFVLTNNGSDIGEVNVVSRGFIKNPVIYQLEFKEECDVNYYAMLFLLMNMPTSYS
ncbi:hypothetical protein SAMN05444266_10577 [Chitinophaga jiangningensis]|uniref:Uncharacterized protein n=1 Tax=Chitinophaga jiangningensis TaxID=1419482 RepID=A0A1M7DPC2_9BACT|nr:hypothetical protein [Chitinophaga jiangningensis]SHL81322.1 hypothetical protein SAMN05444266_10577 [Chitinophaga jiangningensis]